jgi:hypothetical protein
MVLDIYETLEHVHSSHESYAAVPLQRCVVLQLLMLCFLA